MLIIPITGKMSWRNPPVITISIIIINCIVLFLFQSNDRELEYAAVEYYLNSGLAEIEVPIYIAYRGDDAEKSFSKQKLKQSKDPEMERQIYFYKKMENDAKFLEMLRDEIIIDKNDPEYENWVELRNTYEKKLSNVVSLNHGFRPAYHEPHTFVTYMFLHGGFGHLFGNTIFLWLVGCILEMGCGRLKYSILYLVTGLGAVVLFWIFHPTSTIPLIGASGAISGLMGAFTILFGRKKIKIFLYMGFYFNYLKFPAIALFPIWIGNEFFQLFFGGASNVAYMAHIGGLISGAAISFVGLKYFNFYNADIFKEEPGDDEISQLMEETLQHIGNLDFDKARTVIAQILEKDPGNYEAMNHLFNIDKHDPESERFHDTARKFLNSLSRDKDKQNKVYGIYHEYKNLAKPKLSPNQYIRFGSIFAEEGHIQIAEKVMTTGIAGGLLIALKGHQILAPLKGISLI